MPMRPVRTAPPAGDSACLLFRPMEPRESLRRRLLKFPFWLLSLLCRAPGCRAFPAAPVLLLRQKHTKEPEGFLSLFTDNPALSRRDFSHLAQMAAVFHPYYTGAKLGFLFPISPL